MGMNCELLSYQGTAVCNKSHGFRVKSGQVLDQKMTKIITEQELAVTYPCPVECSRTESSINDFVEKKFLFRWNRDLLLH